MEITSLISLEMTLSVFQLGTILVIMGLLLNNWKPPIKEQYVFIILGITGMILGYLLKCGVAWGFIWAGLVFYKSKMVEEFKLIKESLTNIQKLRNTVNIDSKENAKEYKIEK